MASRMRLHRSADRQPNRALHLTVRRLRNGPPHHRLHAAAQGDGLSKNHAVRCLQRFVAREVFNDLKTDLGLT